MTNQEAIKELKVLKEELEQKAVLRQQDTLEALDYAIDSLFFIHQEAIAKDKYA